MVPVNEDEQKISTNEKFIPFVRFFFFFWWGDVLTNLISLKLHAKQILKNSLKVRNYTTKNENIQLSNTIL